MAPTPKDVADERGPDSPTDLTKQSAMFVLRKTAREFSKDQCTDLAAALTYYAVLALFPAMIALLSLVGLFNQGPQHRQDAARDPQPDGRRLDGLQRAEAADRPRGRPPGRRGGVRRRPARRAVVGVRVRRGLRPRDEPDVRDPTRAARSGSCAR